MPGREEAASERSIKAAVRFERKATRLALELQVLDGDTPRNGILIHRISVKLVGGRAGDVLVTVAAEDDEGRRIVGFHADEDAYEALRGCMERIANKQMRWKDDEYA